MAEQFLYRPQVAACSQEVGGKAVAHLVGVNVLLETAGVGAFNEDVADAVRPEFLASVGKEDVAGAFRLHQSRSRML